MLDEDEIAFEPTTGEVRIDTTASRQLLFRVDGKGLRVWSKVHGRERTIPWPMFLKWATAKVCEAHARDS